MVRRSPASGCGVEEAAIVSRWGANLFRVVTINLEQNHKRWAERHPLISAELAALKPDIIAFNEVCVPIQSAKTLRDAVTAATGVSYTLVQQTKVNGLSEIEGQALLSRYPVIETGNLDYQTRDMVALVARVLVDGVAVDVYVTHLFRSRGEESLRLFRSSACWPGSTAGRTPRRRSSAATSMRRWTSRLPP